MALDLLPDRLVTKDELHKWVTYAPRLEGQKYGVKYLSKYLRSWIENLRVGNPLQIPWVRALLSGGIRSLHRTLCDLEAQMGERVLPSLLADTLRVTTPAHEVSRDIASLFGEILAYRELRKRHAQIEKITEHGDWKADDIVVSVKSVLDMGFNYQLLENAIEGLLPLAESESLRMCRSFRLAKGKGLDYQFLKKLLGFINEHLEPVLRVALGLFQSREWVHLGMEAQRYYLDSDERCAGFLNVSLRRYRDCGIMLNLKGEREGEGDDASHVLEIAIEERHGEDQSVSVTNDMNTWWGMPEVDKKRLGRKISENIDKLKATKGKLSANTPFKGWINIAAHPSIETGIAKKGPAFRDFLTSYIGKTDFEVIICAHGGFELSKPHILVFAP